jgi:hypothetical protein
MVLGFRQLREKFSAPLLQSAYLRETSLEDSRCHFLRWSDIGERKVRTFYGGQKMIAAGSIAQNHEAFNPVYDYDRLERVVTELLSEHRKLRGENEALQQELVERDRQLAGLDLRVSQQEQRRTDALKRVDDLIAQVEGFATLASHAAGN